MDIQKTPLTRRLHAAAQGKAAHPEYIPALVNNLANIPISEYLSPYPAELERLAEIIRYPHHYMSRFTYLDIVIRVQVLYEQRLPIGNEAMDILAKPFLEIYQRFLERSDPNG